ncbi:peptide chain release factor 1 [Thrips palmi]|uniref:Peptide chain release factor 1 n=1 Tax=Thrips palmi TaxID=161013 RepID=A0A6P8YRF8_THRPL|nr:peptide chain release factor 1 [Thrips palmi]
MLGFCAQRLYLRTSASLFRECAKKLTSYHVKNKVMCFRRNSETSLWCGFLKPQHSALYSQNAPAVSMDEPCMKKYLSGLIDASKTKGWKRPNYWYTLLDLLAQRESVLTNISSLNELEQGETSDKELRKLAEEELSSYYNELAELDDEILRTILPRSTHENYTDIMMEISSGAGGQEAMLFANELLRLYENYAASQGWTFFIESLDKSDIGGIKSASIFIQGEGAYYYLQNEIGVHRVQRVPVTSTAGMIHTSTAAVIIMPQPSDVDIKLEDKDLVIETMKASGPGGQNVNKTESAIRVRHLPSGLVVECQEQQSQHRNRELALKKLRTKLYDIQIQKQNQEIKTTRVSQLRNRERSAKIRTYNFPQNRITDHRAHITVHNVKEFMQGGDSFQKFVDSLIEENEKQLVLQFIQDLREN